jgi:4-amino-4-deoxy-L-arabinose transferase-like glycosyltransferase
MSIASLFSKSPLVFLIISFTFVLNNIFGTWALSHAPITTDAREYFDSARAFWHHAYDGKAHYWPPGGPFVLTAFFSIVGSAEESHTQLFMAAVSAATTGLVFLLASEIFLSRRVGIIAAALYGLSPTTILMSRQSEGHVFCAFWIALAALFAVRYFRAGRLEQLLLVAMSLTILVLKRPGSALLEPPRVSRRLVGLSAHACGTACAVC